MNGTGKREITSGQKRTIILKFVSFFYYVIGSQVQELSTAANGYQRVLKENRSLYNMVQDLKGGSQV